MIDIDSLTLSSIYVKRKTDRDIFNDLMPFKVKEILLLATRYDAYAIVREGQFSDKIFGEYLQLNLYSAPRFSSVNTIDEAKGQLNAKYFDMVIIMAGSDRVVPIEAAKIIHEINPTLPVLLLVNNNYDLSYFCAVAEPLECIDRVFVWNGNTSIFMAMIKYIEDKKNTAPDVELGKVRIILLVEDSVKYYSRYLPLIYSSIMLQTQDLVTDDSVDELHMIMKMQARPKILLVSNFEDAYEIIERYKDNLLAVISDVKFFRNGKDDDDAGVELLRLVRERSAFPIPLLLQSHDKENLKRAIECEADFINKNSDSLSKDIYNFIHKKLGFGNFEFLMPDGRKVAEARTLHEFQELMKRVPLESLIFHGHENAFSRWLMARGEINMAERLKLMAIEEFEHKQGLREFILDVFQKVKMQQLRGRIVNFDPGLVTGNRYITRFSKGSLGGKGRGLAFLSNFIENIEFKKIIPDINIRIPATAIIGAHEFEAFIEVNNLYNKIIIQKNYQNLKEFFLAGNLSESLNEKLFHYLFMMKKPLAVRSSGLFEDSLMQPFAGVYATYLLPNNHPDINVRLEQLKTAIKLVYASTFDTPARNYFNAVNYKIEEEKMAILIQELVGHEYNGNFYPQMSGVAQSYNYYPVSHMKPEDGFSVACVGLGLYVVGGEKSYRFCPRYPKLNTLLPVDLLQETQTEFYALDMVNTEFKLSEQGEMCAIKKMKLREGIKDGGLEHCVSTYDPENDEMVPGIAIRGNRVVDFANILKYNKVPLPMALRLLLNIIKQAMGAPLEMEYALDLEPDENNHLPTLYLLQIKPMIRNKEFIEVDIDHVDPKRSLLFASKGMGNGELKEIHDVVYIDLTRFDRMNTKTMAVELGELNNKLVAEGKNYILIGPGRWGTRDPSTGIPVVWSQISGAKVIVEIGLEDFPLDASLGSHFFHNVTSMNVGYFSIPYNDNSAFLNFGLLYKQKTIQQSRYIRHVRFNQALKVQMDGRKQEALVSF